MSHMYHLPNQNNIQNISSWQTDIFSDYGGSDRKTGLISPNGNRYLIKYAEKHTRKNDLETSYVNNILNEHLSSRILNIIGYPVHETFLATYKDELVVCCKNFTSENEKLIEFGRFLRKHYDSGELGRVPDLQQIHDVLVKDEMLAPYQETFWTSYWQRFVGDALTGNFDRHMGNFGYLVSQEGIHTSPIYDNGSTLFPALSESKMQEILSDDKEIMKRTKLFPKAALTVNGPKVSYYDIMASNYIPELSQAITDIVPIIQRKMPEIHTFIHDQTYLSDIRKEFLDTILNIRMEHLLLPAYERCVEQNYDKTAYQRIIQGISYNEKLFEQDYQTYLTEKQAQIPNRFEKLDTKYQELAQSQNNQPTANYEY